MSELFARGNGLNSCQPHFYRRLHLFSRADYEDEVKQIGELEALISGKVARKELDGLQAMSLYRLAERARQIAANRLQATRLVLLDRERMEKSNAFLFVIGISKDALDQGHIQVVRSKGPLAKINRRWQDVSSLFLAGKLARGCTLIICKGGFGGRSVLAIDEQVEEKQWLTKQKLIPCTREQAKEYLAAGRMIQWGEGKECWVVEYETVEERG